MIRTIKTLHEKYIKGTKKQAIVPYLLVHIGNIAHTVKDGIQLPYTRIYISTRVIKHVYDKRPAEEFDFLIDNLHQIVKYPDRVFKNLDTKKGDYIFTKNLRNDTYLASIEIASDLELTNTHCEVITFFRVQKISYLNNYKLLWEWKGDKPSS